MWEKIAPDWIFACEIDADIEVDDVDVTQAAITKLDEQITETRAELQAKVDSLETRKANLLAITYQGAA